jgi:hypothetical protein
MNRETFFTAFLTLQTYFGKQLTDPIIEVYWNVLKKYSDEVFARGIESLINNFHPTSTVPFPLLSDFASAMGISGENRAHAAVSAIKRAAEIAGAWRSVDFGDPALHATINRFGGWPEIANWANRGKWEFQEKNFMRAYEAAIECRESADYLVGHFELDNNTKSQTVWTQKQIEFASAGPYKASWIGAGFSHQLENKSDNKEIGFDLSDLTKHIGKDI